MQLLEISKWISGQTDAVFSSLITGLAETLLGLACLVCFGRSTLSTVGKHCTGLLTCRGILSLTPALHELALRQALQCLRHMSQEDKLIISKQFRQKAGGASCCALSIMSFDFA